MSKTELNGTVNVFSEALSELLEAQINVTSNRIGSQMDEKLLVLKTELEGKLLPMLSDIDDIKAGIVRTP